MDDETICKKINEVGISRTLSLALREEMFRRIKTHLDSSFNGIEYHTIIEAPPCAPGYIDDDRGETRLIIRSKEYLKQKKMNPQINTALNGLVIYNYIEDEQGHMIKNRVHIPNYDYISDVYYITFNNDTILVNEEFIITLAIDEEYITDYEFYVRLENLDSNKVDLKKYSEEDSFILHEYRVRGKELGINHLDGLFRLNYRNECKDVRIHIKYVVLDSILP